MASRRQMRSNISALCYVDRSSLRTGPASEDSPTSQLSKVLAERLFAAFGLSGVTYESNRDEEFFLHPGKRAAMRYRGADLGWLGQVRPDVAACFGIEDQSVYALELSLDALVDLALPVVVFEDLVTYPPASQDLAVVVDVAVSAAAVVALASKAGGKLLRKVSIFDVYEGEQVPDGKRSLALRLVMRSSERTLSEKDITTVRQRVLAALERELGATLRFLTSVAGRDSR